MMVMDPIRFQARSMSLTQTSRSCGQSRLTGYAKPERKESDSDLKETFMRDRAAGPFLFGVLLQIEEAFFMQAMLPCFAVMTNCGKPEGSNNRTVKIDKTMGDKIMRRIAVISAILEDPAATQKQFNDMVSASHEIVRGRMGIPFDSDNMAVISITLVGDLDQINSLTGKLGSIPGVQVKVAISRKEIV